MNTILRNIVAVIAGFVVAGLVMTTFEFVNGRVLYPGLAKAAEGVTDREAIRAIFASAPVGALLVVVLGWLVGSLAGGWTAARMATQGNRRAPIVLGVLLTLAGVANNLMLPPPLWFWVATMAVLLPGALLGAGLGARR